MKKNLFAVMAVFLICHAASPPAQAQANKVIETAPSATIDSLQKLLVIVRSKKGDSAFQKMTAVAQALLQKGTINEELAVMLLKIQDGLFHSQVVGKRMLLQYTSALVHLLNFSKQVLPLTRARALNSFANVYATMGDTKHPGPLYEQALELIKTSVGDRNIAYAGVLITQGMYFTGLGNFDKALSNYMQAKLIYRQSGFHNNEKYAELLNSEGLLQAELGFYEKALPAYEEALAIFRKNAAAETPGYASILNNKANLYEKIGLYQEAIPLYEQILALDKKNFGEENAECAAGLYNFGYLYNTMGQYAKALPMYQHALAIIEKTLGRDNEFYAKILDNLAELYQSLGQYTRAEVLGKEALRINEKAVGKTNIGYARNLANLASLYMRMGRHQKAIPLLRQALQIVKDNFGVNHQDYASALHSLGNMYTRLGVHKKAAPLLDSAQQIRKNTLSTEHPDYAASINSLAELYVKTGRFGDALILNQQALEIIKKAFGGLHRDYAGTLIDMGLVHHLQGENRKAIDFLSQAQQIRLQNISANFTTLSEYEKLKLFLTETSKFHLLPSVLLASKEKKPAALNQLYASELLLKGMVLHDQQAVLSTFRKSPDSVMLQKFEQWQVLTRILGQQALLSLKKRRHDVDSLQNIATSLEQDLSRSSFVFRQQQQVNQSVTAATIAQKLPAGEAAIEFIRFRLYGKQKQNSVMYAALIVLPGDTTVRFIPLFEEKNLLRLLKTPSGANTGVSTLYPPEKPAGSGSALYNLIWKPLEEYVKGMHTVYYAPAGLLHRIAFHALQRNAKELLVDRYRLHQLLSTVEIALSPQPLRRPSSASLWGDVEYDASPRRRAPAAGAGAVRGADRSFGLYANSNRGYTGRVAWRPLPATKKEIACIGKSLTDARVNASTVSGAGATEEAFRSLDGKSPQLLHLATHGFFLPVAETKGEANTFTVQQNPLFRSGLVLAGGNRVWSGKPALPGREDGILTAYDISQMDLSNTELVVLSACETALGDLQGYEGVIGLQRAFKLAGVRQLILSLWRVPDKETAELMVLFYRNWLSGQSPREAFRQAQLNLRKKHPPFFWAGFVMVE